MRARGWSLLQEHVGARAGGQPSAVVFMYVRDRQQLDVALGTDAQRGLTVINANLINQ
jgi:hypothetical protein